MTRLPLTSEQIAALRSEARAIAELSGSGVSVDDRVNVYLEAQEIRHMLGASQGDLGPFLKVAVAQKTVEDAIDYRWPSEDLRPAEDDLARCEQALELYIAERSRPLVPSIDRGPDLGR